VYPPLNGGGTGFKAVKEDMLTVILRVAAAMVKQRRRQWSHWYRGRGNGGNGAIGIVKGADPNGK